MHETFQTIFKLHKHTEVDDAGDFTIEDITERVLADDDVLVLLDRVLLREDELTFLGDATYDSDRKFSTYQLTKFFKDAVLITVVHARVVLCFQLRCRQEALDALPCEDKSTLVGLLDRDLEDFLVADSVFCF